MNVAIVSDTHVPDREDAIPEAFRERIAAADHVVHAGDFTSAEMLAEFRSLADGLTAVHGNMEDDDIDLPFYDTVEVSGVTFAVTHTHIGVRTKEDWMRTVADTAVQYADEPRVGVGGHSHVVEDEEFELFAEIEEADGDTVRVLNPGSATGADPAEKATMMTAEVENGDLLEVTLHESEAQG